MRNIHKLIFGSSGFIALVILYFSSSKFFEFINKIIYKLLDFSIIIWESLKNPLRIIRVCCKKCKAEVIIYKNVYHCPDCGQLLSEYDSDFRNINEITLIIKRDIEIGKIKIEND